MKNTQIDCVKNDIECLRYFEDFALRRLFVIDFCDEGKFETVKTVIDSNFSIYVPESAKTSPLIQAIRRKHDKIVDILLKVYRRDLEVLASTQFNKALVAMAEDQSAELLQTLKDKPSDAVVPVLLKSDNHSKPKISFLSKRKLTKMDRSIEFARVLEKKNGVCNINFEVEMLCECGNSCCVEECWYMTALGLAIEDENVSLVEKMLAIPTVSIPKNFDPNIGWRDEILLQPESSNFVNDLSTLREALNSKNFDVLLSVVNDLMENQKYSLKSILKLEPFKHVENFADAYLILQLIRHFNLSFDEYEILTKRNDDNILHLLFEDKEEAKKTAIAMDLIESYPKLVIECDGEGNFPIFYALKLFGCGHDAQLQSEAELVKMLQDRMVEQSGNADIINSEDVEDFVCCLMGEEDNKLHTLLYSEKVSLLQKVFNGKLKLILDQHGLKLLVDNLSWFQLDRHRDFIKFLLDQSFTLLNLNETCDSHGQNAYHRLLEQTKGDDELLKIFLTKQSPDLGAQDKNGKTTFMYFCEYCSDLDLIKKCIQRDPDSVKKTTNSGRNCLFFIDGHHDNETSNTLLAVLLEAGADPGQVDQSGLKPIDEAMVKHNNQTFSALLLIEAEGKLSLKYWVEHPQVMQRVKKFLKVGKYSSELWERFAVYIDTEIGTETETKVFLRKLETFTFEKCLRIVPMQAWRDEINKKNALGNSLLYVLIENFKSNYEDHLMKMFELFYNEMDFDVVNNKQRTIAHAMATKLNRLEEIFKSYPKLLASFESHANVVDDSQSTPMGIAFISQFYDFEEFLEFVSLENLKLYAGSILKRVMKRNLNITDTLKLIEAKHPTINNANEHASFFVGASYVIYKVKVLRVILDGITNESLAKVSKGKSNVLHLFCERNHLKIIDLVITFLSDEQFNMLKEQPDGEGQKPFDLLNDKNKTIFEECFRS